MKKWMSLFLLVFSPSLYAGDVDILLVLMEQQGDNWRVDVTVRHADAGWDHYADGWRIVDGKGEELGMRVLYHPHVNEQPFTRSLEGVHIPAETGTIYIEAHDKVHGWSPKRIRVDLGQLEGDKYKVVRQP